MSALIQDVAAALGTLAAGGAWYAVNTAEPPTYPYITFQRIVSTTNNTFDGATDLQNTRVQIDVYSRLISEAATIAKSIESAMSTASFACVQISAQDMYEAEVKAFRCSADYSVWSTN